MEDKTHENSNENLSSSTPSKHQWLVELGIQSWQAELVLSGLVITGLLQLPELFLSWLDDLIIQSAPLEYTFLNLASIYVLLGIEALILIFGVHLLFRGIWIALLGLNSVYPDGINTNCDSGMGKEAWARQKLKFPSLTNYASELDNNCSLLFSLATYVSLMFIALSIFVLIFYKCIQLVIGVIPAIENHVKAIGMTLFILFLLFALVMQYYGKKYPDNKKITSFNDNFGTKFGLFLSLYFFHKPISYITNILLSNTKPRTYNLIIIMLTGASGYFLIDQILAYKTGRDFQVDRYFTFNNKPDQIIAQNYENLIGENDPIYTPIIQSDVISDKYIKLFVPTVQREKDQMPILTASIRKRIKMSRAQKDSILTKNIEVYRKFNTIFMNGIEYKSIDYQGYMHPKAVEEGLLFYIPTDSCRIGKNILEIRKNYFSKDSIQKVVKIPFMFEKK